MTRPVTPCIVVAALLLASGLARGQGITVVVDGQVLPTLAPPTEIGGRIMVGMRDIFERLGATVRWSEAERQITAVRGERLVELWIGRHYAVVAGRRLPLDVPPMLLGDFTYVPVRFPSEALGATVGWLGPQRTVVISTATMPPLPGGQPPLPPVSGGQPITVRGCLLQSSGTPRQLLIRSYDSNAAETYSARPGTVYQRGRVDEPLATVPANDLAPGDDVTLALSGQRVIDRVEARFRIISITFASTTATQITDQAGTAYPLSTEAKIVRTGTRGSITLPDLRPGEKVALRVNPVTNQVWSVRAPRRP
jgi:hypothetical protein